jgi:zinc transport system substrate-binding protein
MLKILFLVSFFYLNIASASEDIIVTTIKPLESIISNITFNTNQKVISLVGKNDSPHNYHLRPKDMQQISKAKLVFYVANNFETFMLKLAKNNHNIVELISNTPNLRLLSYRQLHLEHHHEDHHEHSGHDHGHHHHHGNHTHEGIDPHIWLDIHNSEKIAEYVAEKLKNTFPAYSEQYDINLKNFLVKTRELKKDLENKLSPYANVKYISFHDAFQYLDKEFKFKFMGEIMLNSQISPNSNRIIELKKIISENNIKCIFSEPQFNSKTIDILTKGSYVNTAELDAEWGASNITDINESYFVMMTNLGYNIQKCFEKKE